MVMKLNLHDSWRELLINEVKEPYFEALLAFVEAEYAMHSCYPKKDLIFEAFNRCTLPTTKVVIIGQDPYHGENQANGLCFSVQDGLPHPPSLQNIYKEIEKDIGIPYPKSGSLERWADQGVLLLNATLTVRAQKSGSHQKQGWERFTDSVIRRLSEQQEGVIFLLWGGFAKKKAKLIDLDKHHVLTAGHPSPLSANRGYWFGNRHFSAVNRLLEAAGKKIIVW